LTKNILLRSQRHTSQLNNRRCMGLALLDQIRLHPRKLRPGLREILLALPDHPDQPITDSRATSSVTVVRATVRGTGNLSPRFALKRIKTRHGRRKRGLQPARISDQLGMRTELGAPTGPRKSKLHFNVFKA